MTRRCGAGTVRAGSHRLERSGGTELLPRPVSLAHSTAMLVSSLSLVLIL